MFACSVCYTSRAFFNIPIILSSRRIHECEAVFFCHTSPAREWITLSPVNGPPYPFNLMGWSCLS
jgi:hypothetical protein